MSAQQSKSFRFRDLPSEIRNKIYVLLLCTFEPPPINTVPKSQNPDQPKYRTVPDEINRLRHGIEPQILRTCRAVYDEAIYVMRKTNCFIKIVVRIAWEETEAMLIWKRLPILRVAREHVNDFKDCVMSHEITSAVPTTERTFMILRRDLPLFCKGLADYNYTIYKHEERVHHIITLIDPYESENLSDLPEFYTLKLQESLISPYRTLRGFPNFKIQGIVPKELSRAAVQEITSPPDVDPDSIISELQDLKSKGNDFWRAGDEDMASDTWCSAFVKIRRIMAGREGEQVREAGGTNFINQISSLEFDLSSNLAQRNIKAMRENDRTGDRELVYSLFESVRHAIRFAENLEIPGSTWEPSPRQLGKLSYRKAVGLRLVGQLDFAEEAIDVALRHLPDDAELKNEKYFFLFGRPLFCGFLTIFSGVYLINFPEEHSYGHVGLLVANETELPRLSEEAQGENRLFGVGSDGYEMERFDSVKKDSLDLE